MKERPILFSAPMVRALLEGTKTQTRRVAKHPLALAAKRIHSYKKQTEFDCILSDDSGGIIECPFGKPGDRLWVRESLQYDSEVGHYYAATMQGSLGNPSGCEYLDYSKEPDGKEIPDRSIPSIHMPRWASRIMLEITGVRVERLKNISREDAEAEGWNPSTDVCSPLIWYVDLWARINGKDAWQANPWVWVVEFKCLEDGAV